jgi:hypothetical protein
MIDSKYISITIHINENDEEVEILHDVTCHELLGNILKEFKYTENDGYKLWFTNGIRPLSPNLALGKIKPYVNKIHVALTKKEEEKTDVLFDFKNVKSMLLPETLKGKVQLIDSNDSTLHYYLSFDRYVIGRDQIGYKPKWAFERIGTQGAPTSVSREHAILFYTDNSFFLTQVNTHEKSETYINGNLLKIPDADGREKSYVGYPLQTGDEIEIGIEKTIRYMFIN